MDLAEDKMLPPVFLPYKERAQLSAAYSFLYGNQKAFTPLWLVPGGMPYYYFFNSPYLYDIGKLKRTVSKYVDLTGFSLQKQEKAVRQERENDKGAKNIDNRVSNSKSSNDNDNNKDVLG